MSLVPPVFSLSNMNRLISVNVNLPVADLSLSLSNKRIWTEGEGEEEIVGGGEGAEGRAGVRLDKFDFAGTSGIAAAQGEELAIGTVGERLGLLRSIGNAAEQGAVGGVPDRDFVVTAGRELRAVRMKREREDGHGTGVVRGCIRVTGGCVEGGEKRLRIGTIEARALCDPTGDELNLSRRERVVLLRHSVIGIGGEEELVEFAFR